MKVGYARVSTWDQKIDLQMDALKKAGCDRIFTDEGISGAKTDRPGLDEALAFLRAGDTLVVWKLDRLGRSLDHLRKTVMELGDRGVEFTSVQDAIDTTTPTGRLFFNIMGSFAEFERDLIRERTQAGLAAARARGKNGGRPRSMTDAQISKARELSKRPELSVSEICKIVGCSRGSYYRAIGRAA